jgi:uracil phosphoribosyltransferase
MFIKYLKIRRKIMSVSYMTHPLIRHKITLLRKESTSTNEFRKLVEEIAMLMGYEALSDLETQEINIKTPLEESKQPVISGKKLAVVPILRAGLGMVNGILALVPSARVGHIGLYRDPVTHEPHEYYCKLPEPIDQRQIVVVDPMLATGGSAVAAVDYIKEHGGQKIKFMSIIAAPKGVETLMKAHPDIQLYVGALDRELDDNAYIRPGLGDAGDRIFGTK